MINIDVLRWSLEELALLEEQKRLWLGTSLSEISSFEEACCGVFDDSGVTRAMDNGFMLESYGSEIVRQFDSLSALIRKVPSNLKPSDLIGLPILVEIRAAAKKLLESGMFADHSKY